MLEPGAIAPDFRLSNLDGSPRTLRELLTAGPVAIAFHKISCPVCQFTFPFLERLHRVATKSSPRLVAISQDDAESTREFNERYGIAFETLLDPAAGKYPASNAFRITYVPSLFLIEPDGRISWSLDGFDKAELERLGAKFGVAPFRKDENVPEIRPG